MTAEAAPPQPASPIPGLDLSKPADRKDLERFVLYNRLHSISKVARHLNCDRESVSRSIDRCVTLLERAKERFPDENATTVRHGSP